MLPLLSQGAEKLQISLNECDLERFEQYLEQLVKWNKVWNLTAITDPQEIIVKHFLDCLVIIPHLRFDCILDVGSGAGFPGLVLAIVCPDIEVTVLDSNSKKTRFLKHMAVTAKLQNVKVVHSRVEDYKPTLPFRCVVARAYARLLTIVEQCRPLVADGGCLKLMKGACSDDELNEVSQVGAQSVKVCPLEVPFLDQVRQLVTIQL